MVNSVCSTITSSVPCSRSSFDSGNPFLLCCCHISMPYSCGHVTGNRTARARNHRELQSENNQGWTDEETFTEDRMFPGDALRPHDRGAHGLDRDARAGPFPSHDVDF